MELYRFEPNARAGAADMETQAAKVVEEAGEVAAAIADGEPAARILEECWDVIQAVEGLMRRFALLQVWGAWRFVTAKSRERGDYGAR